MPTCIKGPTSISFTSFLAILIVLTVLTPPPSVEVWDEPIQTSPLTGWLITFLNDSGVVVPPIEGVKLKNNGL